MNAPRLERDDWYFNFHDGVSCLYGGNVRYSELSYLEYSIAKSLMENPGVFLHANYLRAVLPKLYTSSQPYSLATLRRDIQVLNSIPDGPFYSFHTMYGIYAPNYQKTFVVSFDKLMSGEAIGKSLNVLENGKIVSESIPLEEIEFEDGIMVSISNTLSKLFLHFTSKFVNLISMAEFQQILIDNGLKGSMGNVHTYKRYIKELLERDPQKRYVLESFYDKGYVLNYRRQSI